VIEDMGYESDEIDNDIRASAREQYIRETRLTVQRNLADADLPPQRVYIVSKDALLGIVKGKSSKDVIDEQDLLSDLLADARARRL